MENMWRQSLSLGVLLMVACQFTIQDEDIPHNEVTNWALKFGVSLWLYGDQMTQMQKIKNRYDKDETLTIRKKDGVLLTRDIAAEIKNLMDMKRNAILRVMDTAEQAALSQLTEPNKEVRVGACHKLQEISPRDKPNKFHEMAFQRNKHFDYLYVNTSFSCFLYPNSVSDEDPKIQNDIKWVQELDAIFRSNYEIDPFLGWQYFGTPQGALYRYPAVKWPSDRSSTALDEFRLTPWFVEAITSPKDVVILLDTSPSLSDSTRRLTRMTAKTILDTLGDNDFVNIFTLNAAEDSMVPCFKDLLVQATERNKRKLLQAVKTVKSNDEANITGALTTAFEILHKYNRTSKGSQCNQAIMLIVDNKVDSEYNDIFKQYNWPHKPVRVFTYLTGKSKSKESEMKIIACNNKGFYEHIQKVEEIDEKVLNYLLVMARPLVMYQTDHPIHWSSVYLDSKSAKLSDSDGNLVVTASTAAFDKRHYAERTANVLGVAAADLPIQEIKRLTLLHKLGVSAHSFLINNNGHLIHHPELRIPLYKTDYAGNVKQSSLGVDLSDVEFTDLNSEDENNTLLLELRQDMIDQKEGERDIRLKLHYDSMRRINFRSYKYFFHPIYDTPFSFGIALPLEYGMYDVSAEEEVKRSPYNVTDFFTGRNWAVHPDWVYCDYLYPEYRDFISPEERVLHFIHRSTRPGWKWMSMRPRPLDQNSYLGIEDLEARNKNSYFCDKNLLQSLIFDAKATQDFENPTSSILSNKQDKHIGHDQFGVTMTFIATRSGLLRWKDHASTDSDQMGRLHFSQTNSRSIDEIWYKRAVDQHEIEDNSFVFSVPFSSSGSAMNNPQVTATHAIFAEKEGRKAPVLVIGIQFQYRTLAEHFLNITAKCTDNRNTECKKTCTSDDLDCYVLDDNGFIIISEKAEHTGQFFGEIDGTIMDSLVQDGIYKKVFVHDHQGSCEDDQSPIFDSAFRIKPFQIVFSGISWLTTHFLWLITQISTLQIRLTDALYNEPPENENPSYPDEDYRENVEESNALNSVESDFPMDTTTVSTSTANTTTNTTSIFQEFENETDIPSPPPLYVPSPHKIRKQRPPQSNVKLKTCTKKVALYTLQSARLNNSGLSNPLKGKLTNCHATGCERPFSVQKIPHSNLILLVVDTLCPCGSKTLSIQPKEVTDDEGCKLRYDDMYRRIKALKCVNYHPEELEIQMCGQGYRLHSTSLILLFSMLVYAVWHL